MNTPQPATSPDTSIAARAAHDQPARAPAPVPPADDARYAALQAHDARFDGRFFVGVSSTGVYCRPVCRVKLPKRDNCRFFDHAAQAEAAGYRPCLRCRPERAPGQAPIDARDRLAWIVMQHLQADDSSGNLQALAARLGFTDRHLRRVFSEQFGVAPVQFVQTQRLLLAKALLTDTPLSITEVALAAGFGSLRRFNHLFVSRYGLNPSSLRRKVIQRDRAAELAHEACITLEFAYRPPLDWQHWLQFVQMRCIAGVEAVQGPAQAGAQQISQPYGGRYWRTVRWAMPAAAVDTQSDEPTDGAHRKATDGVTDSKPTPWLHGWISLQHADPDALSPRPAVVASISASLLPVLPGVVAAVRRLLDLDCDPGPVAQTLGELANQAHGVRIPGAFDGFEMAVRAVLGQQVTVKAAHTLAGRLVARFGQPFAGTAALSGLNDGDHAATTLPMTAPTLPQALPSTLPPQLTHLFPTPAVLAQASLDSIASLGIVRQRAQALIGLAQVVHQKALVLQPSPDPQAVIAQLRAIPGIGPWTAHYIALRALAWPDAWPTGDVALIKALGVSKARDADAIAERWRPWRGYATLHLWRQPEFWRVLQHQAEPAAAAQPMSSASF